jgi:hypothetical protein
MKIAWNRASMARLLADDLDPQLRQLLERRFADMITPYGDLRDSTTWIVVDAGIDEADLIQHLGFSPLVEPISGVRFGCEGFQAYWDHLIDHGGWLELAISFGSSDATILLIQHVDGVMPDLRTMCEAFS